MLQQQAGANNPINNNIDEEAEMAMQHFGRYQYLHYCQLRNLLTDMRIRTGKTVFPVHSCILFERIDVTNKLLGINLVHECAGKEIVINHLHSRQVEDALLKIYRQPLYTTYQEAVCREIDSQKITRGYSMM